jgi:predicted nucleic acid-binding protein
MGVKAFVDTNILLRATFPSMDQHHECDALLKRFWLDDAE